MGFNYISLVFVAPAVMALLVGVMAWRRRSVGSEALLAVFMLSTVFWTLGYALELSSSRPALLEFWGMVQYVGIATAPTFFFLLMIHYAGLEVWLTKRVLVAVWTFPVLTLALRVTNGFHGLVHRSTEVVSISSFVYQVHKQGPWFWLVIGYSYLMLWGGVLILIYFRSYARVVHRRQMSVLVVGALAPLAGSLAYISGYRPLGFVDLTPLGFAVSALAVAWGVVRNRVLDVMPVARTALVDSFPDGLFMFDPRNRIVDMNATAASLLGLDVAESTGKSLDVVLGEWPELRELCSNRQEGKREFPARENRAEKPQSYLEARLNPLLGHDERAMAYLVVITDVTQRRRAADAITEWKNRYEVLAAATGQIVYESSLTTGQLRWSKTVESVLGYTLEEMGGAVSRWGELIHPEDRERVLDLYTKVDQEGRPFDAEYRFRHRDGYYLWFHDRGYPVPDPEGKDQIYVGVMENVTERRQAEDEHRHLEEKVRQTQKLESLGVLAGGIAHDFNNLLTAVLGNASLVLDELSHQSPLRPMLEDIDQTARRAADLCRQMLAYSGKGRFFVCPLSISDIVLEMGQMLAVSVSKKAILRYDLDEGVPSVEGDPTQIRQIVMNLIINASEALGEGEGEIVISSGRMACDRGFLRQTQLGEDLPAGEYVFLQVSDTGCGMDAETLGKIFDPFFTTKFTGRGLGLAAVLGIVRGHKGTLRVTSEPEKGTRFMVLFPAMESEVEHPVVKVETVAWHGKGTVLLVDDEEKVRDICRKMLEHLGFDVLVAGDGREALQVYERHRGKISCVLLDLTMPRMDGNETLRELRRLDPEACVVMCSGYDSRDVVRNAGQEGLAGFIQKPYDIPNLVEALKPLTEAQD